MQSQTKSSVGRFPDLCSAEAAIQRLSSAHIPTSAITVMACADGELVSKALAYETGVVPVAVVGGGLGAIAGLIGTTWIATGPVGPTMIMAAVLSAGATGGVGGALAGLGWWRMTAARCAQQFGGDSAVWVAVRHEALAGQAMEVMCESGGQIATPSPIDPVDEASKESFPASDPPSWISSHS